MSRERNVPGQTRQTSSKKAQKAKKKQSGKGRRDRTAKDDQKSDNDGPRESFVACACLQEHEDHIVLFLTRNNGLDLEDKAFLDKLKTLFWDISHKNGKHWSTILSPTRHTLS